MSEEKVVTEPTQTEIESYAREAVELVGPVTRFLVKQNAPVGAIYYTLQSILWSLEDSYPEVKKLKIERPKASAIIV